MTESRNETLDETEFDTILYQDIDFSGTITFHKPLLIRGNVTGEISADSLLVVDEQAVVNADITAPQVVIRVHGNITTAEISFEAGSLFNGRCTMSSTSARPGVQDAAIP